MSDDGQRDSGPPELDDHEGKDDGIEFTRESVGSALLVVSSVLLTVVSLYTTFSGLRRYFELLPALGVAGGVQLGLLGLAWRVRRGGARTVITYAIVMGFSVIFSFVFLQAELTKDLRSAATRNAAASTVNAGLGRMRNTASTAQRTIGEALERLSAWQALENSVGFSTRVCGADPVPFLREVCERLRSTVASWETSTGRAYREGPGTKLVYGALGAELDVARGDSLTLARYATVLTTALALGPQTSAVERLNAYRNAATLFPAEVIARYSPGAEGPSNVRDDAYEELTTDADRQWQSFIDLAGTVHPRQGGIRLSLATMFSAGLALSIDLIVLAFALGAGSDRSAQGRSEAQEDIELEDVREWLCAAFIQPTLNREAEETLLGEVIERIEPGDEGRDVVTVSAKSARRLLDAMVRSQVAHVASAVAVKKHVEYTYVLDPRVPRALIAYLRARDAEQHQTQDSSRSYR